MIIIEKTFPKYQKHKFNTVFELTNWAWEYAINKGIDAEAYIRTIYEDDEFILIEDKDYTLKELFYDGWREINEDEEIEEDK